MCLESVGRVVTVADDGTAVADFGEARRTVSLVVLEAGGDHVVGGDWLVMHSGIAVRRVSAAEAAELGRLIREAKGS